MYYFFPHINLSEIRIISEVNLGMKILQRLSLFYESKLKSLILHSTDTGTFYHVNKFDFKMYVNSICTEHRIIKDFHPILFFFSPFSFLVILFSKFFFRVLRSSFVLSRYFLVLRLFRKSSLDTRRNSE